MGYGRPRRRAWKVAAAAAAGLTHCSCPFLAVAAWHESIVPVDYLSMPATADPLRID